MFDHNSDAPLVVFGEDWGAHPSSTQHFMKRIVKERPVIWVNSIGLRSPTFTLYDMRRIIRKLTAMITGGSKATNAKAKQKLSEEITPHIIQPIALPFPGNKLASLINGFILSRQVKNRLKSLKLNHPILWLSLPTALDVVGKCGEKAVVYYAGDDFSALAGVDHAPVTKMEQELAEKSDAILAASNVLARKFPRHKCFIIPHGVDYELFSIPKTMPEDAKRNGNVAGFYGSIDEWMDQDLMVQLANRMPQWQFQLIGPAKCDLSKLQACPNIDYLGPKPHHALPAYVQNWDCALLPFKLNNQIIACNPLKLREYMASGTPIISKDFPAARDYADTIHLADTVEDFQIGMENALQQTVSDKKDQQSRVKKESWDARIRNILALIAVLQNKTVSQNETGLKEANPKIS